MKRITLFLSVLFGAQVSFAIDADFAGYFRGGTGLNLEGGRQECFYNSGIPGNFLRLGNECSFYGELGFLFHHKKPTVGDESFFRTQMRLTFNPVGLRMWEGASSSPQQIEAFVTAGGFSELPGSLWVGKRFYRDVDLNIFDWYYYAEMSGVGAGIDDIPVGQGYFAVAHLIQAKEDFTSVGRPVLQALDLRLKMLPIGGEQNLNVWGVVAHAPENTDGTTHYVARNGGSLAARVQGPLAGGNNNSTLMLGYGAMKDFNIYASTEETTEAQNQAWNVRVVEDWTRDVSDKWAIMFGLAANHGQNGQSDNNVVSWQAVGIRPIYYVSDRFQWVLEAGYSHIKDEGETLNGAAVGDRELGRVTIAPQFSIKKSIWGRPVLRAFVSHTFWNTANRSFVAYSGGDTSGDAIAPTFLNRDGGTNFGYQFETWF